ncbi:host cell division inhibitor Icd-like protein [Providencia rettgeri]|uniref:host cell division inhibitor Icd-like protein n=1 Tax=Providencia rettgeri TaxID=587 RepID=UPI00221F934A|nr:host cell division inhibitor Icd-like protein [Providencia rettgeri]ELR5279099.1 host cell division inhibitor Icd-like protein [Providencia rettgeri]UYV42794.1 host cell division inhibitor Icd-like protein [Providencia rettgeri]
MLTYQEKASFLAGNQSAKHFANLQSGAITPLIKGGFIHLFKIRETLCSSRIEDLLGVTTRGNKDFIEVTTRGGIEFLDSIKKGSQLATLGNVDIKYRASENYENSIHLVIGKGNNLELIQKCALHHLRLWVIVGYSKNALAKSSARIGVLNLLTVTHDAPSVFFCVHAYAHLLNAVLYRAESMVAAAEQPKGWLESVNSSNANSTVVTTPEIGVSSGDSLTKLTEIIVMMATPTQTQFKFLFLSIKRSDTTAKPCRIAVTAPNEHDARLMLVRDYILSFAGRLPAQEVAHA